MSHPIDEIVSSQKRGQARGIVSICSAQPWVLRAAMQPLPKAFPNHSRRELPAAETFKDLLVESTCNQVNQFGGYTGMTPADFVAYLHKLAAEQAFPFDRLILGGDHLGPSPWQSEPAEIAMQKAADLVRAYVLAGYTKIHLDASMRLGDDDPTRPLDLELSASRTATLARVAENTLAEAYLALVSGHSQGLLGLRYVIGSEVPIPGGATVHETGVSVTTVESARATLEATQAAFGRLGLGSAWQRVVALVVQPGVEFGDDFVLEYRLAAAHALKLFAETTPFVFEAHSTDYQTGPALQQLVRDHFAILKVGPGLTFAFREAVFALAMIENELQSRSHRSRLIETVDDAMLREPANWEAHYRGTSRDLAFARKYSLSDRIRYYWGVPVVQAALARLLDNLAGKPLPRALLGQFLPQQAEKVLTGQIPNTPEALILDKVTAVLETYARACG